jgi:hypothetical protein
MTRQTIATKCMLILVLFSLLNFIGGCTNLITRPELDDSDPLQSNHSDSNLVELDKNESDNVPIVVIPNQKIDILIGSLGFSISKQVVFNSVILPNTTVRWSNVDRIKHTLSVSDGVNLGPLEVGASCEYTFQYPGIYMIKDSESNNKMVVIVQDDIKRLLNVNSSSIPQIDFFAYSYGPYDTMAEEALYETYKILGDSVKFVPHYVIYSNYQGGGTQFCIDADSKYCSMHGAQEMAQDIRELCAYNKYGIAKYFEFAKAMNTQCNAQNADSCWENVAQNNGLEINTIKSCYSQVDDEYLAKELELSQRLQLHSTILINGEKYVGKQNPAAYHKAICDSFTIKPDQCSKPILSGIIELEILKIEAQNMGIWGKISKIEFQIDNGKQEFIPKIRVSCSDLSSISGWEKTIIKTEKQMTEKVGAGETKNFTLELNCPVADMDSPTMVMVQLLNEDASSNRFIRKRDFS